MAYFPIIMPYPGAPGAPFFDGQNIIDFLDRYSQLCSDYRLSESEKIYRLPWYCEYFIGRYVRILIKDADWTAVRTILRREYKENDLDQLINSREFLEALKKKPRSEDDDLMQYCYMFATISKDLVLRKRLDRYTQCQWFLQGLPERIVMEIFYQYDIDLEDNDSLDFGDILKKALVLVKRRKNFVGFIQDKETDLVYKYAEPQEKVPATLSNFEPFTHPTPLTQFQTVQGVEQEDISVVRIHASRLKEVKASEGSSSDDVCPLVSDLTKDFYENLEALFAEPVDEDLVQLPAAFLEPFAHVEGTRVSIPGVDIKGRKTIRGFRPQAPRKDCIGTEKRRFPGPGGLVIGRPMKKAMKGEDHG